MRPKIPAILRTLKASIEEHVIPELESNYARGQAGQIALTLEWLANGWVEPLQKLREGNVAIRATLMQIRDALEQLAVDDSDRSAHWLSAGATLGDLLGSFVEDTSEAHEADRDRLTNIIDELVMAAGPPVAADKGAGPLWALLLTVLEQLAAAETYYGPIPLPDEHWER